MLIQQKNVSLGLHDTPTTVSEPNILSDEVAEVLHWIVFTVVCQTIDVLGVVSNVINIMCFVKQGFKDSVNISLLGLAVSDKGCLSTLIWTNICYTPAFMLADLPFDPNELQYITSGMMHTVFTRITGWITAFITLERCLCITAPLKIKSILTPKRVTIITACLFIFLTASVSPVYASMGLGMKYFPHKNKTIIGLVFAEGLECVTVVAYVFNNVFLPFSAFMIIFVCTVILVISLNMNAKWRKQTTNTAQADNVTNRNTKVVKMVLMISLLFIVCFIPDSAIYIALSMDPDIFMNGKYRNLCIILGGIGLVLESTNSSVNIFIYYHMSKNYRAAFRQIVSARKTI